MAKNKKDALRFVWMVEVRTRGKSERWQPTGPTWHSRRKDAKEAIKGAEEMWPSMEYQATKYTRKETL